jgi:exopolysaccharide production protein ExoY
MRLLNPEDMERFLTLKVRFTDAEMSMSGDLTTFTASEPKGLAGGSAVATPAWKRALDVCCILAMAPVVLPLCALLAVLVKCVSRGPVLFCQDRVGYLGRRFACLKFRTMHVGTSTSTHEDYARKLITSETPMTKLDDADDERIIPLGPVVRAMGLDELPQLWNVLRGEMSLVGPRPCLPAEFEAYQPAQRRRFNAAPGLTGLWQVSGKNSTTFARMIELDVEYIRRRSLWFDLGILLRTIPVVVTAAVSALRRRFARLRLSRPSAGDIRPPAAR